MSHGDFADRAARASAFHHELAMREVSAGVSAGGGADICEDCGDDIAVARRQAMPSARTCLCCQLDREERGDV